MPPMKRIDVAIAIVCRSGRVLICQRRLNDRLGGCWEFPGGKAEDGEPITACLARELQEELAIRAAPVNALPTIEHDYPDIQVRLHPYICKHVDGEPQALACEQTRWIRPAELRDYPFPPANTELIDRVIALLLNGSDRSMPDQL